MIGIYFSGTGNTKYCVERFVKEYDSSSKIFSIENDDAVTAIKSDDIIVMGYPVQYSNFPKILSDFIISNKEIWNGKTVFIIVTMAMFCGDGAGVLSRLLKKYNAKTIGGLHLVMPDSIADEKVLKRSLDTNRRIVSKANQKIISAVKSMRNGKPKKEGLHFYSRILGFWGQRLWFYNKTINYSDKLKINSEKCVGCHKCVEICPMKNIFVKDNIVASDKRCTMCYRCVNKCQKQAITLLGNEVVEQSYIEKYI